MGRGPKSYLSKEYHQALTFTNKQSPRLYVSVMLVIPVNDINWWFSCSRITALRSYIFKMVSVS